MSELETEQWKHWYTHTEPESVSAVDMNGGGRRTSGLVVYFLQRKRLQFISQQHLCTDNWTDWISESSTTPPRPSAALNSQCNHDRKSSLVIRKWTLWAAQYHNWVYERTGNDHETIANQMKYNCAAIFPLSSLLLVLHSSQRLFTRKKMQFWRESGNKIMINDWFLATCIQPTTHTHALDWIKILK